MVGSRIAHYVLVRQVGSGGMGAVYEATDEQTHMRVAIKVLRAEFARNREALTRFVNEAKATNLIDHPGVVKVYDSGTLPDGIAYLVMEFLDGETLSARMRRYHAPMPELEVRRVGWQLASALAAAHKKTVFHRDLKPGNIMLVPELSNPGAERVKLLDFGIAKVDVRSLNLEDPQTRSGILMGTPHYMSPEQCRGAGQVDGAADVYSLGVILFQMLTGRLPFMPSEDGEGMLLAMHIYEPPPKLRDLVPGIGDAMQQLVLDMLKKDRNERPTMAQVCSRLEDIGGSMGIPMDVSMTFEDEQAPTTKRPLITAAAKLAAMAATPTLVGTMTPRFGMQNMATIVSAPSLPSTLGGGTGQVHLGHASPARRRSMLLPIALGVAAVGLVVTLLLVRRAPSPDPDKPPPPPKSATTTSPPPVARHCELRSEPSGAQVVRESDQAVLGSTPWKFEQPPDSGPLVLLLRKSGFGERALALDCQTGPTRTEKLEALPHPPPVASTTKSKSKSKAQTKKSKSKSKKATKKKSKKKSKKSGDSKVLVVE